VLLHLSFQESVLGTTKNVTYDRLVDCDACKGTGVSSGANLQKCNICRGSGQDMKSRGGFVLYTTCKACSGSGQINPNPCKCCSGKGLQHTKTSIEVDIPPGISEDLNLSVPGAGHKQGRKIGDLIVHFKVFLNAASIILNLF